MFWGLFRDPNSVFQVPEIPSLSSSSSPNTTTASKQPGESSTNVEQALQGGTYVPVKPHLPIFRDRKITDSFRHVEQYRKFQAYGFGYCKILDGSVFDASVYIRPLKGSVGDVNPVLSAFTEMIDTEAKRIREFIGHNAIPQEADRGACYWAAEGANSLSNITDKRLLVQLNGRQFFEPVLPMTPEPAPQGKPHYKLAYLIMVHTPTGFPNLKNIIDILDDGMAIILIHVDGNSPDYRSNIESWLEERRNSKGGGESNVLLSKHSYQVIWGHISIVYAQLACFWELWDKARWDYVINLSNYDFPLAKNADIYRILTSPKYVGKNWIELWLDSNEDALNLLAFMEHTWIPDEMYFSTVIKNIPEFADKHINDKKRYLRFPPGQQHPAWLSWKDRHLFPVVGDTNEPRYFFARKVSSVDETKLVDWIKSNLLYWRPDSPCSPEQIPIRPACLRKMLEDKRSDSNEKLSELLIIVPVNTAFYSVAMNLVCSIKRSGYSNPTVLFWALDIDVHEMLTGDGQLSVFLADIPSSPSRHSYHDPILTGMMRAKPAVIEMGLKAGFDVLYLDADTVIMRDFRPEIDDLLKKNDKIDVFVGIDEFEKWRPSARKGSLPNPAAGVMYLRHTPGALKVVEKWKGVLENNANKEDQEGLSMTFRDNTDINLLNVGNDHQRPQPSKDAPQVWYLDQMKFINGHIYFRYPGRIEPAGFKDFVIVHANGVGDVWGAFRWMKMWLIGDNQVCPH
ncbi:hypothetical protein HK102_010008 [Quaeritorhiza haematococci]|nr:hypothetical protein HK102_010008 [Quaeritorhiza haematococci]